MVEGEGVVLCGSGGGCPAPVVGTRVKRDRLVSRLLQDRGALRLISAPCGFGKSSLALEYAQRLFGDDGFSWVDASTPDFLRSVDAGSLATLARADAVAPGLLVIDDLPYLDEERAQTLSGYIDLLLYQGSEVMVTTVPSHDCLRAIQPDRVLITAIDLLVSKKEYCGDTAMVRGPDEAMTHMQGVEQWERLRDVPFGLTPACVWGDMRSAQRDSLASFFEERLPLEVQRGVFCMLLLGRGDFDDLDRLGVGLRTEFENMLIKDYPFLGIDPLQRSFVTRDLPMETLHEVVVGTGVADVFVAGAFPLAEKVLGALLDRGDAGRASEVLEYFCPDERCGAWLLDRGWDLLDCGELALTEMLFERCPERLVRQTPGLCAMRAWCHGLQGDVQEAVHYASRASRVAQVLDRGPQDSDVTGMMAYLALLAFDYGGLTVGSKTAFACEAPAVPADVLAVVVDNCSEVELTRALSAALIGRCSVDLEDEDREQREQRAVDFGLLLTQHAERFQGSLAYRLALHLVCMVETPETRDLVKDLGCGMVVAMRRHGVHRFTEAVLVADLWRCGFFGVSGHAVDLRDARLLNEAAIMLRKLSGSLGIESRGVPWEAGSFEGTIIPTDRARRGMARSGGPLLQTDRVPVATVRLFGCAEVLIGEDYIPESRWRRKTLQLFAVLVIHQGRDVLREFLFEQLWPNVSYERAQDSYYTAWSNAMAALEEGPYLERRGEFCRINHHYVNSDVSEFEQLMRRLLTEHGEAATLLDICARLESLYRGGLMPAGDACPFIEAQRERYQTMYVDAMVTAAVKAIEVNDARIALWFARKAMDNDPCREDVFNALMGAQVAAGQRCSAIRTYFKCRDFLRDELGLDPSGQIQERYDQLIASDPALLRLEP